MDFIWISTLFFKFKRVSLIIILIELYPDLLLWRLNLLFDYSILDRRRCILFHRIYINWFLSATFRCGGNHKPQTSETFNLT